MRKNLKEICKDIDKLKADTKYKNLDDFAKRINYRDNHNDFKRLLNEIKKEVKKYQQYPNWIEYFFK